MVPSDNELRNIPRQANTFCRSLNEVERSCGILTDSAARLFHDDGKFRIESFKRDNFWVGGKNGFVGRCVTTFQCDPSIGKKQESWFCMKPLRRNIAPVFLWSNPNGVRLGLDDRVLILPKQPPSLHRSACATNLLLDVHEAAFVAAIRDRRKLNAFGLWQTVFPQKIFQQGTALLKDAGSYPLFKNSLIFSIHFFRFAS